MIRNDRMRSCISKAAKFYCVSVHMELIGTGHLYRVNDHTEHIYPELDATTIHL
jgi:hypothetical protein